MIKKKLKQSWNWIKETSVKFWKIITAIAIGGAVLTASLLIPSEYPSLMIGNKTIEFAYTDDNTDENLIIHTDKHLYNATRQTDIYVSVENKSQAQNINIKLFCVDSTWTITKIQRAEGHKVMVNEYEEVCHEVITATSTSMVCNQEIVGTRQTTENRWIEENLSDYSSIDDTILTVDLPVKSKGTHRAKQKTEFFLSKDETAYFKIHLRFPISPVGTEEEFFIEVIGDKQGYGHLDPTVVFQVDTDKTLTTSLNAYYKLEDNTDYWGSNNGTEVNSPTYTSGKVNNALTLVKVSGQFLTLPNGVVTWDTNLLSINLLFKLTSTTGLHAILMSGTTGHGINIYYDGTNLVFSKPNVADCYAAWPGKDTGWHMLTLVGRSSGNGMEIYLDGESFATSANTTNFTDPNSQVLPIGAYISGGSYQADWYFGGQIDEVGIWEKSLSAQEIIDLWNGGDGQTMVPPSVRRFIIIE